MPCVEPLLHLEDRSKHALGSSMDLRPPLAFYFDEVLAGSSPSPRLTT
jgi:hypothetical protein